MVFHVLYDGVVSLSIVNGSVIDAKYRRVLQKHFLPLVAERQRGRRATILQHDSAPMRQSSQHGSTSLGKTIIAKNPLNG